MVNHKRRSVYAGTSSILGRLRQDRGGNVLAIAAACIPPVLILVGGGVDMSRAYMTQASLQAACDAGVLAGRRAQAKSGTWGTTEQGKAQRMFTFNFQSQAVAATSTTFTPTDAGSGVISGTATTTIPTVLMSMFGTNTFTLRANCSAEYQISNIDVMFVLDTTGSMADCPDGSTCNSNSSSKIAGLKEAIRQFYYTIAAAVPSGGTTRVRFGFVPYSGTVNMKNLVAAGDIPSSYFTSATNYQTQLVNYNTPNYTGTKGTVNTVNTTSSQSSSSACNTWANASPNVVGTPPSNVTITEYSYVSYSNSSNVCTRAAKTYTLSNMTLQGYKVSSSVPYRYISDPVDTSQLKTFTAVPIAVSVNTSALVSTSTYAISASSTVPTAGMYDSVQLGAMTGTTGITTSNITWAGCVEERNTVNTLFTNNTAPSGAYDHDLASAPTNDATRWHPYIGALMFDRNQTATLDSNSDIAPETEYCVPAAMKFTTVDTSAPTTVPSWLETFIGTLVARGNTYHDVGMTWGTRLANPNGIMSTNVNAGNLTSVSRHIIMLTDGLMAPNNDVYNEYGLENLDARVAPSGSSNTTLETYHNARFLTACQTAKNLGYTIWFVGFGQTLTSQMTACATSGRAFYASDTSTLQSTFRNIASQVADLRLKT